MDITRQERMRRLRALSRLMDTAFKIPGTGIRFGLDGIIGLIPGVGDTASALMGAWLIREAWQMGVGRPILARMAGNILLDTLVGAVPVLGDLFDVAFKANVRNLALLERHLALHVQDPKLERRAEARGGRQAEA